MESVFFLAVRFFVVVAFFRVAFCAFAFFREAGGFFAAEVFLRPWRATFSGPDVVVLSSPAEADDLLERAERCVPREASAHVFSAADCLVRFPAPRAAAFPLVLMDVYFFPESGIVTGDRREADPPAGR